MEKQIVIALKGIIIHQGRVLIVKRSLNDEYGGGTWECVGGKMEFGEDLEAALLREIKEEVGLEVIIKQLLYASTFHTDHNRQVVILSYLCESLIDEVILSPEHTDYCWATPNELETLLDGPILNDFKQYQVFSYISNK